MIFFMESMTLYAYNNICPKAKEVKSSSDWQ